MKKRAATLCGRHQEHCTKSTSLDDSRVAHAWRMPVCYKLPVETALGSDGTNSTTSKRQGTRSGVSYQASYPETTIVSS